MAHQGRDHPRRGPASSRHLRFVLFDPEVESYSYRIAKIDDLLGAISDVTGVPVATLAGYVAEADTDPELGPGLARRLRWRFDVKRRPQLGNRLGWYVLIRALRPAVASRPGSTTAWGHSACLRALDRNRAEGAAGELISFDRDADVGDFVDPDHPGWQRVIGSTLETIAPALAGHRVGVLFQDSDHSQGRRASHTVTHGRYLLIEWPAAWLQPRAPSHAVRRGGPATFTGRSRQPAHLILRRSASPQHRPAGRPVASTDAA